MLRDPGTAAAGTSVPAAATSVAVTMGWLWAASLVADIVAHTAVHGEAPRDEQRRTIAATAAQALETAVVPVLLIALSATGIWTLRSGLVLAVAGRPDARGGRRRRRPALDATRHVLVVVGELALGLVVVAIKLAAR